MKFFKSLMSIVLLNIFIFSNSLIVKAADNDSFNSGIYSLQNDIYHSSETGRSMARTYLNSNMKMEIRNGQVFFTVKFSGAQYMENFRMIVDGGAVDVNTVDRNTAEDTITLKFKGNSPKSKIIAKIYVGPMERDVSFNIIPNLETASLIQAIEEPKPKKEVSNKNVTKEESINKQSKDEIKKENTDKKNIVNNKVEENIANNKVEDSKSQNKDVTMEQVDKNKKESKKEEKENTSNKQENKESKEVKVEEVKVEEVNPEDEKNKDIKKENNPSEKIVVEDEGKINTYEKINKKAIAISLGIGVVIISGTIFALKKFKKQNK